MTAPKHALQRDFALLGLFTSIVSPADRALVRYAEQAGSRDLLPHERVAICLRRVRTGKSVVNIVTDVDHQQAHYQNLMVCGSIWMCPICAAKITERRAAELQQAVTVWHTCEMGFVALLTFTLRHQRQDDLRQSRDVLRSAYRKFRGGKSFRLFAARYNWQHSVTALEVTYGDNGWHPHLHVLAFFGPLAADRWREFEDEAKRRWQHVVAKCGGEASYRHGLDVREGDAEVYDYVAKFGHARRGERWTIEREVAKAPSKRSSGDGRTPFGLLGDYVAGDAAAGDLFREYAMAFKGHNQLTWSRGLRDVVMLEQERSDGDVAEELPDPLVVLASLPVEVWRQVLRLRVDVRGALLVAAWAGGVDGVEKLLETHGMKNLKLSRPGGA